MESSSTFETTASPPVLLPKQTTTTTTKKKKKKSSSQHDEHAQPWPRKKLGVTLEASYSTDQPPTTSAATTTRGGPVVVGRRRRSLTGEDLEELKGCLDLGFGFSYHEIPDLCSTLPALELCYSMSQTFLLDRHHQQQNSPAHLSSPPPPVANWKFSSPGDDPEEVKARLKYWAQAVACTVKLCS
ncbi:uncharacterized protein M6B38_304160 [Iris pallida]|uniref:Uncharacterized protein n=1 Tax=Iris pallida TaxID=29817 RepID=A0AAX6HN08_IRIPA|nr:uncharacterized protein M6B38_328330 [Iris pallida]KAJ6842021.1 uncharacterized protein M6B38_304160 [Iris pallida]